MERHLYETQLHYIIHKNGTISRKKWECSAAVVTVVIFHSHANHLLIGDGQKRKFIEGSRDRLPQANIESGKSIPKEHELIEV